MLKTQPKTNPHHGKCIRLARKAFIKCTKHKQTWKRERRCENSLKSCNWRKQISAGEGSYNFATVEACISIHISHLQGYPQHSTATLYFILGIWHPLDFLACCLCIKFLCIKDFCVWTQHWKAGKGMSPGCCMSSLCQQMVSQAEHSLLRKNVLRFHCILLCLSSNYIKGKIKTLQLKITHLTHRQHCCTS